MRCRLRLVVAAAFLTLACDTSNKESVNVEPPLLVQPPLKSADSEVPGFGAYALWDCSPLDSPYAVTVYVATDAFFTTVPPEAPHFRIEVFRAGSELSHRTLQWPADDRFAMLEWCAAGAHCKRIADARVIFGAVRPSQFVEGTIERSLATGVNTRWHFKANWGPRRTGCG